MQVLQGRWDRTFSDHSYGFFPGGRRIKLWDRHKSISPKVTAGGVVDLDLEKFLDRVNRDVLTAKIAERVGDKRLLKLIVGEPGG